MKKFMAIFVAIMMTVMTGCASTYQESTRSVPVIEEVNEDGEIVIRPAYADGEGPVEITTRPRWCRANPVACGVIWTAVGVVATGAAVGIGVAAMPDHTTVGNRY